MQERNAPICRPTTSFKASNRSISFPSNSASVEVTQHVGGAPLFVRTDAICSGYCWLGGIDTKHRGSNALKWYSSFKKFLPLLWVRYHLQIAFAFCRNEKRLNQFLFVVHSCALQTRQPGENPLILLQRVAMGRDPSTARDDSLCSPSCSAQDDNAYHTRRY